MPAGMIWAYLWTPTEVRKTSRRVPVYLKLANLPQPDLTIQLDVPYRDVRACEGFAFKMLGACVQVATPTCWAVRLPARLGERKLGGHIVIEPWLTEVPIRVPERPETRPAPGDPLVAVARRRRWPNG